jgi:RND family efflux transporter MFP subunit
MRLLLFVVCCAVVGCTVLASMAGCNMASGSLPPPVPPKVTVAEPLVSEVRDIDEYTGRVDAIETVEVRARVSGYLQEVFFKDGDFVEKGAPLFQIDPRTYQAEFDQARARINLADAKYQFARAKKARDEVLVRSSAVSKEEFEQSVAAENEALAARRSAEADTETNRLNLEFTKINAEIAGRIDRTFVTPGNMIQTGAGSAPLTRIVSVDPMYVYFNPDELAFLRYSRQRVEDDGKLEAVPLRERKLPAKLILANNTEYPEMGFVDFASNELDPSTGTLSVRAVFPNTQRGLVPGMFVRLQVESEKPYKAMLIPERAINTDQSDKFVYVIDAEGNAQRKNVKLGTRHGRLRVVQTSGDSTDKDQLQATDKVVISGGLLVRPGQKVDAEATAIDPDEMKDQLESSYGPATVPSTTMPPTGAVPAQPGAAQPPANVSPPNQSPENQPPAGAPPTAQPAPLRPE